MEIIELNHEELSKLERLLQAASNVSAIIDSLYILEITGKKNSPEYEQKLSTLQKAISFEDQEYEELGINHQECLKFAKLLSAKTNIPIFDIKTSNSFKHYHQRIYKRVINILMSLLQNDEEFHKSILPSSLISEDQKSKMNISDEDMLTGLSHSFRIQMSLDSDINYMFLSLLQDHIDNSLYATQLTQVKYCIATTNKELETIFLNNRFQIPKEVFFSSQFINEILQEGKLSFDIIKLSSLKPKAQIEINKLLKIPDSDYSNLSTNVNSIISSCYIRAILALMNEDEVKRFEQEFIRQIEKPEYLRTHLYDRISENIILSCFKSFQYDKKRTRVLSTK